MSWVEDYFKISKSALKVIGLWPYHQTKWTVVPAAFILTLLTSFIFVQLAVFVTHEVTFELVVIVLSFVLPSTLMWYFYFMFYFNVDSIREIMLHIHRHWESLNDTMEFTIMGQYANLSKMLTHMAMVQQHFKSLQVFIYSQSPFILQKLTPISALHLKGSSCITFVVVFAAIMSHVIPITLDIVAPINVTRGEKVHILSEYFVNHSKYYLLVVTHVTMCVCVGVFVITSTSVSIVYFGIHAGALFKVANYRMGLIMGDTVLQISSPEQEYVIYERITHAVTFHRTAMQFCDIIVARLANWIGVLLVIGVTSASISLFRLLNAISYHTDDLMELFISTVCVSVHFFSLFFGNYIGQQVTDNNSDIFDTVYNLPWYVASENTKHLLLFLLQRGNKKLYLSISSLFNASYEGFTTLMTTSISYFTVLYSLVQ